MQSFLLERKRPHEEEVPEKAGRLAAIIEGVWQSERAKGPFPPLSPKCPLGLSAFKVNLG